MTVKTAATIVYEQSLQLAMVVSSIGQIASQINAIASEDNSVTDIDERLKSLVASGDVQLDAGRSQTTLLQGAFDRLSELLG